MYGPFLHIKNINWTTLFLRIALKYLKGKVLKGLCHHRNSRPFLHHQLVCQTSLAGLLKEWFLILTFDREVLINKSEEEFVPRNL